jgi:poly-gamma-glutamate system protein
MPKNDFKYSLYSAKPIIKIKPLIYLAILIIIGIGIIKLFSQKTKLNDFQIMVNAASKMHSVFAEIQQYRSQINISIDPAIDPKLTGFIGEEFSAITSTLGNLDAKQISLNPDFAALLIKWMKKLNVSNNDTVIIHASASFPALTIMAIIACEELNLEPIIFSSTAASSWGANIPNFTYLDIENHLFKQTLIKHRSTYVTPGGVNDNGSSLWEGGLEIIEQSAKMYNYDLHIPKSLENAINQKWDLIQSINPKLFLNIGGNQAAMGDGNCALNLPVGLITQKINCEDVDLKGLIIKCNQNGTPVIHLLKIKELAVSNGIAASPIFPDKSGDSEVYYVKKISLPLSVFTLLIIFLFFGMQYKRNSYNIPSSSITISTNRK